MPLKNLFLAMIGLFWIVASPAVAADIAEPTGDIVLSLSGNISQTNGDAKASFDLSMLDAMPQTDFTTSTIWTEGTNTFSGVLLKDVLDAVGANGRTIRAIAINDYAVDIPTSDAVANGPIIATKMDGKAMSVRDKGPLWIIYPFDGNDDYRSETIYSRSIWQLRAIEIVE